MDVVFFSALSDLEWWSSQRLASDWGHHFDLFSFFRNGYFLGIPVPNSVLEKLFRLVGGSKSIPSSPPMTNSSTFGEFDVLHFPVEPILLYMSSQIKRSFLSQEAPHWSFPSFRLDFFIQTEKNRFYQMFQLPFCFHRVPTKTFCFLAPSKKTFESFDKNTKQTTS